MNGTKSKCSKFWRPTAMADFQAILIAARHSTFLFSAVQQTCTSARRAAS